MRCPAGRWAELYDAFLELKGLPDAQQMATAAARLRAARAGAAPTPDLAANAPRSSALLGLLLPGTAPEMLPLLAAVCN